MKKILLAGILLGMGFCGLFVLKAYLDILRLKHEFPVVLYHGNKTPPEVILQKQRPRTWASISQISKMAIGAVIVSEDWAFYQHKGYDPKQIEEALKVDLKEGKYVRGASTITQQVAKNIFLTKNKSLWRKVKELLWALMLEKQLKKQQILELYLNIAEFGEGLYGIGSASRYYYSVSPSELDAKQGAFLAMLLPSPKKYSSSFRLKKLTPFAQRSVDRILRRMAQAGYVTRDEAQSQAYSRLSFEQPEPTVIEEEQEIEEQQGMEEEQGEMDEQN